MEFLQWRISSLVLERILSALEPCLQLGVTSELGMSVTAVPCCAQSFCRKFVWHRECLWPEDLPDATMLVLAANDDLVPSALVRAMLTKMNHPCEVMVPPDLLLQTGPHLHATPCMWAVAAVLQSHPLRLPGRCSVPATGWIIQVCDVLNTCR